MKSKLICKKLLFIAIMFIGFIGCKKSAIDNQISPESIKQPQFNSSLSYGTVTDQSGITYKIITIGTQTWMAENLRTTIFRNGDVIPEVKDEREWYQLSTPAYCNYSNTQNNDTIAVYGRLYNWFAVSDNRKLAPDGWHIPSRDELDILIHQLGRQTGDDEKIIEAGNAHWKGLNPDANNESGFTALPGGWRHGYSGVFWEQGWQGGCWSTSQYQACMWSRDKTTNKDYIIFDFLTGTIAQFGFSVRCVKD